MKVNCPWCGKEQDSQGRVLCSGCGTWFAVKENGETVILEDNPSIEDLGEIEGRSNLRPVLMGA